MLRAAGWRLMKRVSSVEEKTLLLFQESGIQTMHADNQQNTEIYKVIINDEEQYSIWPADRTNPPGWKDAGKTGTKEECLAFIKDVWTDMRPLSLRRKMEEDSKN